MYFTYIRKNQKAQKIEQLTDAQYSPKKKRSPLLRLNDGVARREHFICCDWDGLSQDQLEQFEETLRYAYDGQAFIFKSPSGNPKAIFRIQLPQKLKMTRNLAHSIISEYLLPGFEGIDKAGLDAVFLTEEAGHRIGAGDLFKLEPLKVSTNELEDHIQSISFTLEEEGFKFYEYQGKLPAQLLPFVGIGRGSEVREGLVRILIAAWNLLDEFNLSTKLLAIQLDTTPATISRLLKELRQRNLLIRTSNDYQQGVKAKGYKAKGALKVAIEDHKRRYKSNKKLPTKCIDGEFYGQMLRSLFHFQTIESFMTWVQTLDGINYHRIRKAERWASWHFAHPERWRRVS